MRIRIQLVFKFYANSSKRGTFSVAAGGLGGLDPFASDDEDQLKVSFYSSVVDPK
jgi:hypothetical protein